MKKVVAIIPAFNESATIAAMTRAVGAGVSVVIVIDDASSDGTGVLAKECGAVVLRNEKNRGYKNVLSC